MATDAEFQALFDKAKALAIHCQILGDMARAMSGEAELADVARDDLIQSVKDYAAARSFDLIDGPPRVDTRPV